MADVDPDVGVQRELATGGVVTLNAFRHHDRPHVDPTEERFGVDAVVFTLRGGWGFRGPRGRVEAHPDMLVTARRGDPFAAEHDEDVPTDETLEVTFGDGAGHLPGVRDVTHAAFARHGVPRTRAIRRIQGSLWHEARSGDVGSALRLDLLALELLVELARTNEGTADVEAPLPSATRDAVAAARRYMDEHLDERITMATLSRVGLMSPFHLARAFRRELGISPHRYLLQARLDRAAELLADTTLTVTRVAERTGFASPAHLSRSFAGRMGMPPTTYRRTLGRRR